jgi:hypothetical protein
MRVRAIFWLLLGCTCLGILAFAIVRQPTVPTVVQAQIEIPPSATDMATLLIHVTDNEGTPVNGAQVQSVAYMTSMVMSTYTISLTPQSQGNYVGHLPLYMAGSWAISFSVKASCCDPCHRTLYIKVT